MTSIMHRDSSPRPPRFKKGARVGFIASNGYTMRGEFVRAFTPVRGAGLHYEILVDARDVGPFDRTAVIFANGPVGRTVTRQD